MPVRALILTALAGPLLVASLAAPAQAAAEVSVSGSVSTSSASVLRLGGHGFQSIRNGHGGIYVLFGTVRPGWRPSAGGAVGRDFFYVPDSESKDNRGFQRYVAFPGSDTAGSANGGSMSGSGSWATSIRVPGPVFRAFDRAGGVRTIDCRTVTCGVITIGAHGVTNARNETFTPVSLDSGSAASTTTASPTEAAPTATTTAAPEAPRPAGKPTLEVDRRAAEAGRVLSFSAAGLPPRTQVSAVLDDGIAGAGPFLVGDDGRLTGVLTLPAELGAGTHELRLYGVRRAPSVRFPVRAATEPAAATVPTDGASSVGDATATREERVAWLFAGGAGLVFLLALARLALLRRRTPGGEDAS